MSLPLKVFDALPEMTPMRELPAKVMVPLYVCPAPGRIAPARPVSGPAALLSGYPTPEMMKLFVIVGVPETNNWPPSEALPTQVMVPVPRGAADATVTRPALTVMPPLKLLDAFDSAKVVVLPASLLIEPRPEITPESV